MNTEDAKLVDIDYGPTNAEALQQFITLRSSLGKLMGWPVSEPEDVERMVGELIDLMNDCDGTIVSTGRVVVTRDELPNTYNLMIDPSFGPYCPDPEVAEVGIWE